MQKIKEMGLEDLVTEIAEMEPQAAMKYPNPAITSICIISNVLQIRYTQGFGYHVKYL